MLNTMIVLLAGCGAAYLGGPRRGRGLPNLADLAVGLVGGFVGASAAQYLGSGVNAELALPLLLACGLALGLQSRLQMA